MGYLFFHLSIHTASQRRYEWAAYPFLNLPGVPHSLIALEASCLFGLFPSRFFTLKCTSYSRDLRRMLLKVWPRALSSFLHSIQIFAYWTASRLPCLVFWASDTLASLFLSVLPLLSPVSCFHFQLAFTR